MSLRLSMHTPGMKDPHEDTKCVPGHAKTRPNAQGLNESGCGLKMKRRIDQSRWTTPNPGAIFGGLVGNARFSQTKPPDRTMKISVSGIPS